MAHTWEYGYDALGNRTAAQADGAGTTLAYGTSSHQLQQAAGALNPSYLAGRTTVSFGYSNANRLTTIVGDGVPLASYAVNGLGQRVRKDVAGTATVFVHDEQGRLVGEYDGTSSLIQETVWLDDLPIATLRPTGTGTPTPIAINYVHADHLGTPRAITRPSDDQLLWRWDNAEPFGNGAADENPSGLGAFSYNLRFPGQYFDAETGLHYNYFRDYDPTVGRYVESDPIGLDGGLNTHGYVKQDPLRNVDPTGEDAILPFPGIGAGAGAAGSGAAACVPCWVAAAGLAGYALGSYFNDRYGPQIGDALDNIINAAPGNVADTQVVSDYNAVASAERLKGCPPPDRCEWLRQNASKYRPDQVKATQKAWGCRGSRASKDTPTPPQSKRE